MSLQLLGVDRPLNQGPVQHLAHLADRGYIHRLSLTLRTALPTATQQFAELAVKERDALRQCGGAHRAQAHRIGHPAPPRTARQTRTIARDLDSMYADCGNQSPWCHDAAPMESV